MISKSLKYYHTVKFLKWSQIKYRLLYLLPPPTIRKKEVNVKKLVSSTKKIDSIASHKSWLGDNTFQFLNLKHKFDNSIIWNYKDLGKLWTYNLCYFDFLHQEPMSKYEGLGLIYDFISKLDEIEDGMEAYPISLRTINWIKFFIKHEIKDVQVLDASYFQLRKLSARPEYHLMGNHLLENAFCLFMGGIFFNDNKITDQGKRILEQQLEEQVLSDGAHFELSPMYHKILFSKLLDTISFLQSIENHDVSFLIFLKEKARKMLSWLQLMMFSDSTIPNLNDSTQGIAPSEEDLIDYAARLEIIALDGSLGASGYRKIAGLRYEMLVDVGNIGPDYIPGHAHSDTLNFILHDKSGPVLVDRAISTYEKTSIRTLERSTGAHNTVTVDGREQSEVWGGFRVAKRAKIVSLVETATAIQASHDGYQKIACEHERTFSFSEHKIEIEDKLSRTKEGLSHFHFHKRLQPKIVGNRINYDGGYLEFREAKNIVLQKYDLAVGFNKTVKAVKAIVHFREVLHTTINIR